MNRRRLALLLILFCQLFNLAALSQAPCPVDACVTADPVDNLALIMATTQSGICSPPISCYASNSGSPGTGTTPVPTATNFAPCNANDTACNQNYATYKQQYSVALGNLQAIAAKLPFGTQRNRLYGAISLLTANNMMTIAFGSLDGTTAADTKNVGDGSQYGSKFVITFDMNKIKDIATFTIDLAHEGTHASDLTLATQGGFPNLTSLFQLEYRAYEASAWTAQAFSVNKLTYSDGVTIWDNSWPAAQQATLIDQNVTQHIQNAFPNDPTHAPVNPHDPYPNQ